MPCRATFINRVGLITPTWGTPSSVGANRPSSRPLRLSSIDRPGPRAGNRAQRGRNAGHDRAFDRRLQSASSIHVNVWRGCGPTRGGWPRSRHGGPGRRGIHTISCSHRASHSGSNASTVGASKPPIGTQRIPRGRRRPLLFGTSSRLTGRGDPARPGVHPVGQLGLAGRQTRRPGRRLRRSCGRLDLASSAGPQHRVGAAAEIIFSGCGPSPRPCPRRREDSLS